MLLNVIQNVILTYILYLKMVRMKGVEPPRLAAHAPKACVSTISPHPHIYNYKLFLISWKSGNIPGFSATHL